MLCAQCGHFVEVESKIPWGYGHTVFHCPQIEAIRFADWDAKTCPHFRETLAPHGTIDSEGK